SIIVDDIQETLDLPRPADYTPEMGGTVDVDRLNEILNTPAPARVSPFEWASTAGNQLAEQVALLVLERSASEVLGENLEAAGQVRPVGSAAHHIVATGARDAEVAREILEEFGIDINDPANG